jgi:hypothetical protein
VSSAPQHIVNVERPLPIAYLTGKKILPKFLARLHLSGYNLKRYTHSRIIISEK